MHTLEAGSRKVEELSGGKTVEVPAPPQAASGLRKRQHVKLRHRHQSAEGVVTNFKPDRSKDPERRGWTVIRVEPLPAQP